jgi:hypothetical protein
MTENPSSLLPKSFSTGLKPLDRLIGGVVAGIMYAIGGGTGTGKTRFMIGRVVYWALHGVKVLYIGTELSHDRLKSLMAADHAKLHWDDVLNAVSNGWNNLPPEAEGAYNAAYHWIEENVMPNVLMCDKRRPTPRYVMKLMARAKELGCQITVIDYVGFLDFRETKFGPKHEKIEQAIFDLNDHCENIGMATFLVCQYSRDDRAGALKFATPQLQWLAGSAAIENTCWAVLLLSLVGIEDPPEELRKASRRDDSLLAVPSFRRIWCGKHRSRKEVTGKCVHLKFEDGAMVATNSDELDKAMLAHRKKWGGSKAEPQSQGGAYLTQEERRNDEIIRIGKITEKNNRKRKVNERLLHREKGNPGAS